jgi:hypothetical protein
MRGISIARPTNLSPWSPGLTKESVFKSQRISRRTASPCSPGSGTLSMGRRLLDVTNHASIAAAAERIRTEFCRLGVLVNNAAISHAGKPGRSLEEMAKSGRLSFASLDEVQAVFETNMFGVIVVTQAMLPLLREAPAGRIVDVRDLLFIEDGAQRDHARLRFRPDNRQRLAFARVAFFVAGDVWPQDYVLTGGLSWGSGNESIVDSVSSFSYIVASIRSPTSSVFRIAPSSTLYVAILASE